MRLVRGLLAATALGALLAGLPWALSHFVGWPVPDHLPSWQEIHGVLFGQMTITFVRDVLVCLTWLAWACFTFDVARCAIEIARAARLPDLSAAGPVHRVAAVLVGAVLISSLGHRADLLAAPLPTTPLSTTPSMTPSDGPGVAAVALEQPARVKSAVVRPYNPQTGVHDSLWLMARRTLGDGHRWPEIYALNKGKPQPNGGTFTRPSLIFPGERMTLPDDAAVPAAPPSKPPTPPGPPHAPTPQTSPPGSTTPSPPPTTPPTTQPPATTHAPHESQASPNTGAPREAGFGWGEELFVGLGLATAISTALVMARRHNRRRYRPGSGDRSDLPVAPVVYQLRLAHLRADQDHPDDGSEVSHELEFHQQGERPIVLGAGDNTHHRHLDNCAPVLSVGVRDGREIALNLAAAHGLGLTGTGAAAALRALLVTAVSSASTTTAGSTTVIVPAEDLAALLGRRTAHARLPASLHVAADLDAALDALEAETLARLGQPPAAGPTWAPAVLVARTPTRQSQRLQAVLDNGSTVGVTGLMLGQWTAGVTAYVRDDGTITGTSPGLGEQLRSTRVFRLGDDHTVDLLAVLTHADTNDRLRHQGSPQESEDTPGGTGLELLATHGDVQLANGAQLHGAAANPVVVDEIPDGGEPGEAHHAPLRISVLGPPRVWWRPTPASPDSERVEREITSAFQPRLRELLAFLAVHPDGATREALVAALWATSVPERTTNAMNTSLSRLRRALAAATDGALSDVVLAGEGRYRLDSELVEVDYWSFAAAVSARRSAASDHKRVEAYRHIVDIYTGPLADGLSTEWIETAREAIRRDAIDAVAALARALVDRDPQQTLDLLEMARAFDPHNELIYRDIMRLQERLGQHDAIPRTLTLLRTRLAEIDEQPTYQTAELAERLRRRNDTPGEPTRGDHGHSRAG